MGVYRYGPISSQDLKQIVLLEAQIYTAPWSQSSFLRIFKDPAHLFWGAYHRQDLIGYGCGLLFPPQFELQNLAVHPEFRGRGIGKHLFQEMMKQARLRGAKEVWLECRVSNLPAIALYRSMGLKPVGIRPRYYQFPCEDAILWRGEIPGDNDEE